MKLILVFMSTMTKKVQVDENECKNILFRIDMFFREYFLAVGIDEKGHTDRDIIFEEKRQKSLEKDLVVNVLELIQVMQKIVMIQIMRLVMYKHLLMSSKIKKLKKTRKTINKRKGNERETRKGNERNKKSEIRKRIKRQK